MKKIDKILRALPVSAELLDALRADVNWFTNPPLPYREAQKLARRLNAPDLQREALHPVGTASVYALSLIKAIQHHVIEKWIAAQGKGDDAGLLQRLGADPGEDKTSSTLEHFLALFPNREMVKKELPPAAYLEEAPPLRTMENLEEIILLWITNRNPAAKPMRKLFRDSDLRRISAYEEIISSSYVYFSSLPGPGQGGLNLIDFLRAPSIARPHSLLEQLEYIRLNWGNLLGDWLEELLRGIDYLKEEERPVFPPGPGPSEVPSYAMGDGEFERFSSDSHWMPQVVLIAKSTMVWLHQLSLHYGREISQLDQIPDQELDMLASRGFNTLWLIGLWERSEASRRIKQWSGNPEAAASAYSLKRYEIAEELGGWPALTNLKERCARRGIRLASDMVPNHTGLDSDWLFEHPEWFLQCDEPPFPGYRYEGESLVDRDDYSVHLEDHYWDHSDAAVTFKLVDRRNGRGRYIYHGNDGTTMPWNDTAQLDYLNPELREVVIQTILHVARNFPVIRFDAAMTLAKKHIQRLWYPRPGSGGAIPSRSRFGLSDREFHQRLPEEFWREVVDRVAAEAPDTLLLAEAFWMMEGYFVRTLGMHRVYNSAFMNMLKNEENAKYRQTIRQTLEYDPEILKRFVNFMNNPDEDTAYAQFGDGDKYFGVCTMMCAMPGLPMFGHGQVEGFREKYGMEYRRAYQDEQPDQNLIQRHEREIFPICRMRWLFAEVENFQFYDFNTHQGGVNENVFVWSNRKGDGVMVGAYNNSYHSTAGSFHSSVPANQRGADGERSLVSRTLAEGMGIGGGEDRFTIFRELKSGLWYIRENRELVEQGMSLILSGYQSQLFMDFHQLDDPRGIYRKLAAHLNGGGTRDIHRAARELFAAPAREPFMRLLEPLRIGKIVRAFEKDSSEILNLMEEVLDDYRTFLSGCRQTGFAAEENLHKGFNLFRNSMTELEGLAALANGTERPISADPLSFFLRGLSIQPEAPLLLYGRALLKPLRVLTARAGASDIAAELLLPELFLPPLKDLGIGDEGAWELCRLVELLPSLEGWFDLLPGGSPAARLRQLLSIPRLASFCRIHREGEITWYKAEPMQQLFWWLAILLYPEQDETGFSFARSCIEADMASEYRLELLFEALRE